MDRFKDAGRLCSLGAIHLWVLVTFAVGAAREVGAEYEEVLGADICSFERVVYVRSVGRKISDGSHNAHGHKRCRFSAHHRRKQGYPKDPS